MQCVGTSLIDKPMAIPGLSAGLFEVNQREHDEG